MAGAIALLPVLYVIYWRNSETTYDSTVKTWNIAMGVASVFVVFLQFTFIIVHFKVSWPKWFDVFGNDVAGVAMFDTTFARPSCVLGNTLVGRMMPSIGAPLVMPVVLLIDLLVQH